MTTGANKDDHHVRGVNIEHEEVDRWADLRAVNSGEACPRCDNGVLEVFKAMEIGHILKLGTKYSNRWGKSAQRRWQEVPIIMKAMESA